MKLFKYQSTGNDFLCTIGPITHPSIVAKTICDRHFGIGADGILIAEPSTQGDIKMTYYNSDGSIAPMCGNGLRAFADFVYSQGMVLKKTFKVETGAGILDVEMNTNSVSINLGQPTFNLSQPNVLSKVSDLNPVSFHIGNEKIAMHILFLGTLHGIVFVDDLSQVDITSLGNQLCHDPFFPKYINVNFVEVMDDTHIFVKTFERGAGLTLSCGTGVAASAVVAHVFKKTKSHVFVEVLGGHLTVDVTHDVILTGPTTCIAMIEYLGALQ